MRCFVVAGFLLTSDSRGPSAIAEFLVTVPVVLFFSISEFLLNIIKQEGLAVASIARDLVTINIVYPIMTKFCMVV